MQNFNTNQTRHFYVAGAIDANVDTNLDIALKHTAKDMFFLYKNADGILTRTDLIPIKNVVSLKKTLSTEMAKPLGAHVVTVDTNVVTLSSLVGKTLDIMITVHGLFDYDESNSLTFVASVIGNSTNTASAAAFHKDLAIAIAKAMPKTLNVDGYPVIKVYSSGAEVTAKTAAGSVSGSSNGVVLVEGIQKYVRGKLSGEPCTFSVAFRLADSNYGDIVWGKDVVSTVAAVNTAQTTSIAPVEVPGNYALADLEFFALGERGDVYRGFNYPNNYDTTYSINPFSGNYNVLTIEYFWQGGAENVQKSPRMIQVAALATTENDIVTALYNAVYALVDGADQGELDAVASDVATLKTTVGDSTSGLVKRVTDLENAQ